MAEKKPKQVWGRRSAQFYAALVDEVVLVAVATGCAFQGMLVGVDTYDLLIRQASGLEMLIPKSNVVYVHRAPGKGEEG